MPVSSASDCCQAADPDLATQAAHQAALRGQLQALAVDKDVADHQLATIGQTIRDLEADTKHHQAKAKLLPPLEAATARLEALEAQRGEATRALDQAREDAEARERQRRQEIQTAREVAHETFAEASADARTRANEQRAALSADLAAIVEVVCDLEREVETARADLAATEAGSQEAQALSGELAALRRQWDETTAALARVEAGRQELGRRSSALAVRRADLTDVDRRVGILQGELVEWQTLTKALGRDGLPVLEIDAAGPTVSSVANDLLASCFGPRFSLELVTQEAKASGKGLKEAFAVQVLDNERGGAARDIGDLSGGEQVIVEEALKNALSLYCNARNVSPIRTCWRDETTGPLDPENAARYLPMLLRVQQLGGFRHVLFISHNPDAAAQADAQIRFAGGHAEDRAAALRGLAGAPL